MYTRQLVDGLSKTQDNNQYVQVKTPAELSTLKPDIIHYPFFDLFFNTLPKRQNIPIIVTVHDVTPLVLPELFPSGIRGKLKLFFQKRNLQHVDKIITDSHCSKKDICKFMNIHSDKIETVYLAADPLYRREENVQKLEEVKTKYSLPEKYIVKVGDINRHKNFSNLLKAMTQIDPDIHLILVGKALSSDAPQIPELVEIINEINHLELKQRVHRLGFIPSEDMPSIYTLSRATVLNSFYEGFGLPALESMMCKTPVIAANAGSIPEIVGNTGILMDPHSVTETSQAIEKVFSLNHEEYQTMCNNSYEQSKNFSLEKMVGQTIKIYESLKT